MSIKQKEWTNPTNAAQAIQQCTKMVYKLAHKWTRNHRQDFNDLAQEGFIGTLTAWERFDGSQHQKDGYRFSSYAFLWIRHQQKAAAEKNWKRLNNTGFFDVGDYESFGSEAADGYELNINQIDLDRMFEKLSDEDQTIFALRQAGHTFAEIAEKTESGTLHQVRNRFTDVSNLLMEGNA